MQDTPWTTGRMYSPTRPGNDGSQPSYGDSNPPTYASFSPPTLSHSNSAAKQRSTILVHQKSPLLVATPPQVTRALAYSHSFLTPLNKLVGLLSWTTGDPWESFLLVAVFWTVTVYGDVVMRWAGPIVLVLVLIFGMYSRRYSPLSSTGWTRQKGQKKGARSRAESDATRHHQSLDDIVDTLRLFTARCNILLDPFLRLTDFLSTQSTATSATTRPALTTLFIRILLITPLWVALTLPPMYILSTKRVILITGTIVLSWHSRPARISRIILWRSRIVRRIVAFVTGLNFAQPGSEKAARSQRARQGKRTANDIAASLAAKRNAEPGIRFTFALYENQRRWVGLGWTGSMLAYERANWTDEHLNTCLPKEFFELPEVEGGHAKWQWVEGSEWHVDGGSSGSNAGDGGKHLVTNEKSKEQDTSGKDSGGWIFYDNKWRDGRRTDGWGRYTRRRKWCRDAELVEVAHGKSDAETGGAGDEDYDSDDAGQSTPTRTMATGRARGTTSKGAQQNPSDSIPLSQADTAIAEETDRTSMTDASSVASTGGTTSTMKQRRKGWFRRHLPTPSSGSVDDGGAAAEMDAEKEMEREREREERSRRRDEGEDVMNPVRDGERESGWGLDDDARMGLG